MGDLIRMPHSEVTATLELLDRLGVTPHDFAILRKASSWSRTVVARVLRTDPFLWAMLCVEQDAERAGFREDDFQKLAANPDLLARLLPIIREQVETLFFSPISDKDLPEELREVAVKWHRLASELGYAGLIAWKVRAGFTLKQHAPKAGPCEQNFAYLQDWRLQNDEPTKDGIVFWIPRILPNSTVKTVDEQKSLLADLRVRYDLPASHLTSFGSAALLAGLIIAHFKITGERVPLDRYWVRTDTLSADGHRLGLGNFDESGLCCDRCHWGGHAGGNIGCFPLGV